MALIICNIIVVSIALFEKVKERRKTLKAAAVSLFIINLSACLVFYLLHPPVWQNFYQGVRKYVTYKWQMTKHQMNTFPSVALSSFGEKISAIIFHGIALFPYRYDKQPIIVFISLGLLIVGMFSAAGKKKALGEEVVSSWFILTLAIMTIYLNLDWSSYFLPIATISAVLHAKGLFYAIKTILKKLRLPKTNYEG